VNLQRQALFTEKDAELTLPKAIAAAQHLGELNRDVVIESHVADLNPDNASLLQEADLILDGTDNFQTRYVINDIAWKSNIPWIYGACVATSGIAAAFVPPSFPCLRCLFESEPPPGTAPTCDTAGILWPAVGSVVSFQITTAFKLLTGNEVEPQLLQFDVWHNHFHIVSLEKAKRADCPTCGLKVYPSLLQRADFETTLCGRNAVQIRPQQNANLDLERIYDTWKQIGEAYRNVFLAKLKVGEHEIVVFSDGRAIIKGTGDFSRARDLYSKYIGL
ncbi:MAG TPA: ThiF family adenylyltransferase, partial [Acidobacteriota bacterium]|nr:ThiF family adenylyltransferase [Acidobacteriota bacterium]